MRGAVRLVRILSLCVAVSATLLAGCKSSCLKLSEKLCECSANSIDKEGCLQEAKNRDSFTEPDADANARCEALIDQCDCRTLATAEGKIHCGLAR